MEKERVLEMLDVIRWTIDKADGVDWLKAEYGISRDTELVPTRDSCKTSLTGKETLTINIEYIIKEANNGR